jgi:aminoglycoside 6'-N-acetyltransferase I
MYRDIPIRVRDVVREDAPAWQAMRGKLWPDGAEDHGPEIASFFAGTLPEPTAVMVAEDARGALLGVVELSIRTDVPGLIGKRTGYVEGLYVEPRVRRRGIARKLLQASRTWAREQRCEAFASDRADRIVIDRSFHAALQA